MSKTSINNILKNLVANGKIEEVCIILTNISNNKKIQNHAYLMLNQFKKYEEDKRLGIVSDNSIRTRIISSILKEIDGLEEQIVEEEKSTYSKSLVKRILFSLISCVGFLYVLNVFGLWSFSTTDQIYSYQVYDSTTDQVIPNAVIILLDEKGDYFINCDSFGKCVHTKNVMSIIKAKNYNTSDTLIPYSNLSSPRRIELTPAFSLKLEEKDLINLLAENARIYNKNKKNQVIEIFNKKEFANYLRLPIAYFQKRKITSYEFNDNGFIIKLTISTYYPENLILEKNYES